MTFNVELELEGKRKIYYVRCFTASGDTQIPGVVCSDFSDGRQVMKYVATYMNETKVFKTEIKQIDEKFTMRNYKFWMLEESPNLLMRSKRIAEYFSRIEAEKRIADNANSGVPSREHDQSDIHHYGQYIDPGNLIIKQVKYSNDDNKLSMTFEVRNAPADTTSKLLLKVFPHGKFNILGVKQIGGGPELYDYIKRVFNTNWKDFIMMKPKPNRKK